ncbi:MAG: ABC transporter permease [Sphingobacteriales bacterium 17-39-43]|jgi:Cu-processing system permease protein|uniref:ABC transporter permease n=1 Tax=Daejeonella sp. TaxID=2805397 RepID=UPI000BC87CAE|nr:ABC transporter permease [Daejeonella sp.]OYZ31927.1 MAG: ABC transporter permease [Sphingobacteriales bacterium 16-39-50]OZA25233.1 MAG: ABC transporter permease [Sphingobacteriales bacterium 17-39-43]HQT23675.1 ABC transporter permease [Daejeonella sp.]HQT58386.1 ABC transporter permease [Daejeonella sp.]
MNKIIKYVITDILRNKIVLIYTVFLLAASFSVFSLEDNSSKGLLSLLNIILIVVPLVSIIFSTIYMYNSAEFIELLVSQPLKRNTIWLSLFTGLASSLSIAFLIGAGIPVLIYQANLVGFTMILTGVLLSIIFAAIAFLATVQTRDKAKGIGAAIMLWLYFSLLFDGLVLFILFQFADYPMENAMIGLSALNPIDLSRILILLQLDVSAMMGYTGAVFKDFFGASNGLIFSFFVLLSWIVIPVWYSTLKFNSKDL